MSLCLVDEVELSACECLEVGGVGDEVVGRQRELIGAHLPEEWFQLFESHNGCFV